MIYLNKFALFLCRCWSTYTTQIYLLNIIATQTRMTSFYSLLGLSDISSESTISATVWPLISFKLLANSSIPVLSSICSISFLKPTMEVYDIALKTWRRPDLVPSVSFSFSFVRCLVVLPSSMNMSRSVLADFCYSNTTDKRRKVPGIPPVV